MAPAFHHPHENWWLSAIAKLDAHAPGLAGDLLRASKLRRHVSAAAIASGLQQCSNDLPLRWSDDPRVLAHGRLQEVIAVAYSHCPPGFIGALGRARGEGIQPPVFYRRLYDACCHRPDVIVALRHMRDIDIGLLELAEASSPILLSTGAFRAAKNLSQLADLAEALPLIARIAHRNQEPLAQSLKTLSEGRDIAKFVQRRLEKSAFPDIPQPDNLAVSTISDGTQLNRESLRFKNCMRSFTLDILASRAGFYVCKTPSGDVIAHIARPTSSSAWRLRGTYGKFNRRPQRAASSWVEIELARIGIRAPEPSPARPREFQSLERLADPFLHELQELDFEI